MIAQICFDHIFQTYTIQGTPKDPGIALRSLQVLFTRIKGRLCKGIKVKPKSYEEVKKLTDAEEQREIDESNALFSSLDGEVC